MLLEHPRERTQAHGRGPTTTQDQGTSLVARIAAHAAKAPAHAAVVDGTVRLSYAGLDAESARLAAHLAQSGVRPGDCVGLFLERSAAFVTAALAVLKAGAAYLPLDPSTPADRLRFILDDAGVAALLTHRGKAGGLPEGPWRVIDIDAPAVAATPTTTPPVDPGPDALAYVIYTSGSTGRPKGVEVTLANLRNLVDWHQQAFAVTEADRASQVAGLGFDAVGWEVWPYLAAGATLHIADDLTRRAPDTLRDWLVAERITLAFVPTVLAEPMLQATWPAGTSLRFLLTGADVLHRRPAPGLPFALVNNYGPTECTVVATSGLVTPDSADPGPPTIGRPILNINALVLDDSLHPVPDGEPGELCLAGAGVARGYRNSPSLTAEKFVTYRSPGGETLQIYRTGDRVRKLDDGQLVFLGRLDDQVKIRGYRIEPGEVTSRLNDHPGVASSVVVARDHDGALSLLAYVLPAGDAPTSSDLRAFLAASLPDYMIPGRFVKVTAWPLTPNGKLDKAALPAPSADNLMTAGSPEPEAADGIEGRIAALVASLLEIPSISREENFFMAGGHSMFGVQLVARLRDAFGVKVSLRQVFGAPTVVALAAEIARLAPPAGPQV